MHFTTEQINANDHLLKSYALWREFYICENEMQWQTWSMYTFLDERFTMYNSTFFRYFRHLNVTEKNYFVVERLLFYRKNWHKQISRKETTEFCI